MCERFAQNGHQYPPAIGKCFEPAVPINPLVLKAGHLGDVKAFTQNLDIQLGFDLKTIAIEIDARQHIRPERVIAVT